MNNDLISRSALKEDFKARLRNAQNWKENALNRGDDEIVIRADATLDFICEVLMTIDNAPTVLHDNYSMGYQDGVRKVLSERQGKWGEWVISEIRCPKCLEYFQLDCYSTEELNKCPCCGAIMRIKDELNVS